MRKGGSKVKAQLKVNLGAEGGTEQGEEPEELLRSEPKGGTGAGELSLALCPAAEAGPDAAGGTRSERGQRDTAQGQTDREGARTENKEGLGLWVRCENQKVAEGRKGVSVDILGHPQRPLALRYGSPGAQLWSECLPALGEGPLSPIRHDE